MEVASQLHHRQVSIGLNWVPRDLIQEADDLSNGIYEKFDMANQITVDVAKLEFRVLPQLLKTNSELYDKLDTMKGFEKSRKNSNRKSRKLKQREPW